MTTNGVALGLIIVAMGAVTYAIRLSLIVLLGHLDVPPLVRRALRFVPPAVFSALVFPELLLANGALVLSLGNPRLLAGAAAAAVAWWSKNVFLAIAAGMLTLWILQAVLPH